MVVDKDTYWTPERIEQDRKNHTYKHFRIFFTNGESLFWNDCEVRFPVESDRIVIHSSNKDTFIFILNNIAGYGYNKGE